MDGPKRLVRDLVDFEVDPRAGVGVWHQDRVGFVDRSARGTFLVKEDGGFDRVILFLRIGVEEQLASKHNRAEDRLSPVFGDGETAGQVFHRDV